MTAASVKRSRPALPCLGVRCALRAAVQAIGPPAAAGLKGSRYNPLPLFVGRSPVSDLSYRPRSEKAALVQRGDDGNGDCVGCTMFGRCLRHSGTSGGALAAVADGGRAMGGGIAARLKSAMYASR